METTAARSRTIKHNVISTTQAANLAQSCPNLPLVRAQEPAAGGVADRLCHTLSIIQILRRRRNFSETLRNA